MCNTVIFDLDGTLLNTIEDLANACNYTLRRLEFKEHEVNEYKNFIGGGRKLLIERILPEENRNEETMEKAISIFDKYYSEHLVDMTKPYEGIMELLEKLTNKKYNLAVVSNKPQEFTTQVVEKYFKNTFKVVYGQRVGVAVKPNPATIYEVIEEFGVSKENCVYVGDSDVDILTANNADIPSVGVAWGFRGQGELEEAGADYIIEEPLELLDVINKITKY